MVGYTGGRTPNPTYQSIGDHTEAILIRFDPKKISYAQLAGMFWSSHNPNQSSYSCQYKNAIWCLDDDQLDINNKICKKLFGKPCDKLNTTVATLTKFYRAEEYHQKYFEKNGGRW